MGFNLNIFILVAALTDIVLACRSGWYSYHGNCYLFVNNHKETWTGAENYCQAEGAHLVEIDSYAESSYLKKHLYTDKNYFIGLSDIAREGEFRWVKSHVDQAYTFGDWLPSEPNSYMHDQDCVVMKHGDHRWSDQACDDPEYFICEY